ncbi:MAG: zinc ribbon domain-containing protein [Proteobacteria bacterium]|jgi:putative FmdB family regulatory protein|nr:zinc ribbon domain-containing protein [Pseudomonadota bacterium]
MPIYEYKCTSCGLKFDKLVKMGMAPPPCPECGNEVQKLVSAAAFVLKGGGWYKDGYGLKPSATGGDSKSPAPPRTEEPKAEKSESTKKTTSEKSTEKTTTSSTAS